MCSEKDGTNVPTPSSPASSSTLPNAFDAAFLARLQDRDEPPAAEEADWAGPWRLDRLPDGGLGFFRAGESTERGHRPVARFRGESDALLTMAIIASRGEAAYRLRALPDGRGYAVQSRAAWGEDVGWLAVFDQDLVNALSWAEGLMRSPEALSFFLEACGRTVLERAGAILEERVGAE
ncbi:MAG TPA: hypothetical protein VEL74_15670 [Thermoanaerobaculia bacterium]|nr:hypothetical protein [Thermoanaerobaculia bacterium]